MKISYQDEQTIWQALNASQYRFGMDGGDGFVTTIENVTGNYRYSSVPSGVTLDHAAASVTYFRFTESEQSAITAGLQTLMQVMAGYLDKPADVRSAASAAYQKAYDNYLGIDSDTAKAMPKKLQRRSRTMRRDSGRHTRSRFTVYRHRLYHFGGKLIWKAVLCRDKRKTAPTERQLYVLHSQG